MLVSIRTQHPVGSRDLVCCHCGRHGGKDSLWFTESGWMCDNCFTEYVNIPEEAKKKLFKHEIVIR